MQAGGAGRGAGAASGPPGAPGQQQRSGYGAQHIEAARQQNLEKIMQVHIKTKIC